MGEGAVMVSSEVSIKFETTRDVGARGVVVKPASPYNRPVSRPRPSDDPAFFRLAPPEGRSRESSIVLDREGHFLHAGERVAHPRLEAGLHSWISRHPDDGRYILTNGYDWTYFTVESAPYFVRSLRVMLDEVRLTLSDGTEEPWQPALTRSDAGVLVTRVKATAAHGPYDARFTRHAQSSLMPILEDRDGHPAVRVAGELCDLPDD
jgi:hypothetical protein